MVEGDNVDQPLNYDSVRSLVGCFVNCAAMGGWAVIHETIFLKSKSKNRLANAAIITALAYLIDYHIVPKRYTPGFEKRFSNRGVALGYLAMFIAFAVSHRWKPVPDKL